jgi:hypothetical protein
MSSKLPALVFPRGYRSGRGEVGDIRRVSIYRGVFLQERKHRERTRSFYRCRTTRALYVVVRAEREELDPLARQASRALVSAASNPSTEESRSCGSGVELSEVQESLAT